MLLTLGLVRTIFPTTNGDFVMASREELVQLRKETVEQVERLRKTGDYGAGAADIRRNAETLLILIEDRLESKR